MRRAAGIVLLLAAMASGQWLETTIQLPDSFAPRELCYNTRENKVYCADGAGGRIAVLDASANALTSVIQTPAIRALCYDSLDDRVFSLYGEGYRLIVIDGNADTILDTVRIGAGIHHTRVLCYNARYNKVYTGFWASTYDQGVWGCSGTTYRQFIPGECRYPDHLSYLAPQDKLYAVAPDNAYLTVMCGAGDTAIAVVFVGEQVSALGNNPTDSKVYVGRSASYDIQILNGVLNQVTGLVHGSEYPVVFCHNSINDRMYCANASGSVLVFGGASDSVIGTVATGASPRALVYSPLSNKVYCANSGSDDVTVIDGATNAVLATIGVGSGPANMVWSPLQNRVYVANYAGSSISVIRDSMTGVEEGDAPGSMGTTAWPTVMPLASGVQRLASSVVFDVQGRRVENPKTGVYFVVAEGPRGLGVEGSRMRKVLLVR
jgi:YVTN family beta-propeller protein